MQTPIGQIGLLVQNDMLGGIRFLRHPSRRPSSQHIKPTSRKIQQSLKAYFNKNATSFDFPLLLNGSAFQKKVWAFLQKIPPGKTMTYGEVALMLNTSPRAVGQACRKNPIPIVIPCHRVVGQKGLGGFSGGHAERNLRIKRWLILHESSDK